MTCDSCGTEPCINPSFCRTCRKADAKYRRPPDVERLQTLLDDSVSIDRAYRAVVTALRPTPQATIEAVLCAVCERGVKALTEPDNLRRLRGCDEAAKAEINRRVDALLRETAA
jgi:hypothetical protein